LKTNVISFDFQFSGRLFVKPEFSFGVPRNLLKMKRIVYFLSTVVLLSGCYKDEINDLKDEIDRLKERMALYESLLDALNNRLYVAGYEERKGGYIITLSDGSQLSVSDCTVTLVDGVMIFTFADDRSISIDAAIPEVDIITEAVIDKMKWLRIQPQVANAGGVIYQWLLDGKEISDEKDLLFAFAKVGTYQLQFKVKNPMGESSHTVVVTVNDKTYVNGITRVFEYLPAPGQFINEVPEAAAGDTPETMRQKAEIALTGSSMISLGGFGGYVIFGFDHTVVNRAGNDFVVLGNAFAASAEPGVIMVSYDANGNGLPDDEWFEIAGSEYHKTTTIKNYEITYYKPSSEPTSPNEPTYIRWTDNQGQSGYLSKNSSHTQTYFPLWMGESYTLKGTFMEANIFDQSGNGINWVNPPYDWGYADNFPNTDVRAQIDIDWAVDENGNPVRLKGIDFVKVYTGNRAEGGWTGEISTEVDGFNDLSL